MVSNAAFCTCICEHYSKMKQVICRHERCLGGENPSCAKRANVIVFIQDLKVTFRVIFSTTFKPEVDINTESHYSAVGDYYLNAFPSVLLYLRFCEEADHSL